MLEILLNYDVQLFLKLNAMHTPWWDTAMLFFTRKETWLPFYIALLAVIFRTYKKKGWIILLCIILGLVAGEQVSVFLKETIQRLRPGHDPAIAQLAHVVLKKGGLYGFVSSHATNAMYILTFTTLLFRNRAVSLTFLGWAVLISYTRIYVGAHYPLDLLGGWILGGITGYLFYKLLIMIDIHYVSQHPDIRMQKSQISRQSAILLFLVFSTVVTTLFLSVYILHKYDLVRVF
jgi:undecaprenyl-diphosphatase